MSRSLKLYVTGLVSLSVVSLVLTSFVFASRPGLIGGIRPDIAINVASSPEMGILLGVGFWTVLTLFAGALPVRMPRGSLVSVSMAPIIGAMALGGPVAAGLVSLVGTTEVRELRGRIPWYGTAANHAGVVLPAVAGGLLAELVRGSSSDLFLNLVSTMLGAGVLFMLNLGLMSVVVAVRSNQPVQVVAQG